MSQQSNEAARHEVQNDLSTFLKRLRQREQQHHKLCDYTNRLLSRQAELEQTMFIHDEISKLSTFLKQSLALDIVHQETDFALARQCEAVLTQDEQNVLGRRVISRVLEVTYAAIDAFRQFGQYYSAGYLKFKDKCLRTVNEGTAKTSVAVRLTSRYLTQKMQIEHDRLKQAITCLETSNYEIFPHLKSTFYDIATRKQPKGEINKFEVGVLNLLRKNIQQHEPQASIGRQRATKRQIRVVAKSKTSRQDREKTRRAQLKKLKKLAGQIFEVMEVQKQDFLDDMGPENKQWVTKRILSCLVSRNKINQAHISSFLQKQPQYLETISKPPPKYSHKIHRCQSLQQELLEKDSQFSRQEQNVRNALTVKDIRISESSLPKKENLKSKPQRRESMRPTRTNSGKKTQRRQRLTVNNIEELDRKKKDIFSSQKNLAQQECVVELQFKAEVRLPKARFPEIAARAGSVSKSKLIKQQQSPIRAKLEVKPSSSYFQQIQKRIIKFCEMKRNLVI